jgi:hypothetical protein
LLTTEDTEEAYDKSSASVISATFGVILAITVLLI